MKTWEDVYKAICNRFGHEVVRSEMARSGYEVAHQGVYFKENGEAPFLLTPKRSDEYMLGLAEKLLTKPSPAPDKNAEMIARLEAAQ